MKSGTERLEQREVAQLKDRLLHPAAVATRLGVSVRTLGILRRSGQVPAVEIGGSYRFSQQVIEKIAVGGTVSPPE